MDNDLFIDGGELSVSPSDVWDMTLSSDEEIVIGTGNGLVLSSVIIDPSTIVLTVTDTDGDAIDMVEAHTENEARDFAEDLATQYLDIDGVYADNLEMIEEREDELYSAVEDMLETFASNVRDLISDYDYTVEDLKNIICGYLSDKGVSVYRPVYSNGKYVEYPYSGEETEAT